MGDFGVVRASLFSSLFSFSSSSSSVCSPRRYGLKKLVPRSTNSSVSLHRFSTSIWILTKLRISFETVKFRVTCSTHVVGLDVVVGGTDGTSDGRTLLVGDDVGDVVGDRFKMMRGKG